MQNISFCRTEEARDGGRERPRGTSQDGSEGLGATVGFRGGDLKTSVGKEKKKKKISVGCLFASPFWGFNDEERRF